MISVDEFVNFVWNYKIPPSAPYGTSPHGLAEFSLGSWSEHHEAREECIKYGMWGIVYQTFAFALAEWIGGCQVLEIMAGAGWLAKALQDEGVSIIATDNASWDKRHTRQKHLTSVLKLEATEAILAHPQADILLVSWPPYDEQDIVEACHTWGPDRPIIYIGECDGGCNAPESFFEHFREMKDPPNIDVMSWQGLHDHLYFGSWVD